MSERLRIAVLGNFESVHTHSWVRWFVERGHDVHGISYYAPRSSPEGVAMHALAGAAPRRISGESGGSVRGVVRALRRRLPAGAERLAQAGRYRSAGLARVVRDIRPDVLHAHFLVEHGFYGATLGFHPYVITTWGSDVLVEPGRDPVSRRIARWALARADAVTSNNGYMADRLVALGAAHERVHVVTLGADRYFLEAHDESINVRGRTAGSPVVLSTRAHEPLYNIGEIVDAYARVASERPDVRLMIANEGSQTEGLLRRARSAGAQVEFAGVLERAAFRDAMTGAEVFVSVPSSDATSVALLQAIAAGCFPIVSDLPALHELVDDGVNGLRVRLHDVGALAEAMRLALADDDLRLRAAGVNRKLVEERGLNETQMARMEEIYLRLARRA
jgi:L-malate glycosyltransferase